MIKSAVPVNTKLPTITGTPQQGKELTEHNGEWTNNPTGYTYLWQQCDSSGANCTTISGATTQSYIPVAGDVGHTIRVQETASNSAGPSAPATSEPTAVIKQAVPVNTKLPTITGTAQQGEKLTEHNGEWTNSPTSFAYMAAVQQLRHRLHHDRRRHDPGIRPRGRRRGPHDQGR